MAALEQLDRLLELQRRREQLAQMVPPGIETSQQVFNNGSVIYRFSHEKLGGTRMPQNCACSIYGSAWSGACERGDRACRF